MAFQILSLVGFVLGTFAMHYEVWENITTIKEGEKQKGGKILKYIMATNNWIKIPQTQ